MAKFFKNSELIAMNFSRFCNQVCGFCPFEDAKSTQISSVVIKILKMLPIYQDILYTDKEYVF